MNATTKSIRTESSAVMLAIDLAKDVFELAFADATGRIVERKRLKRKLNRPAFRGGHLV